MSLPGKLPDDFFLAGLKIGSHRRQSAAESFVGAGSVVGRHERSGEQGDEENGCGRSHQGVRARRGLRSSDFTNSLTRAAIPSGCRSNCARRMSWDPW